PPAVRVAPDRHTRRCHRAQPPTDARGPPTSPRPSECQAPAPRRARRPPRRAASLPTSPAQPIPDTRARAMTLGAPAGSNRLNHRYQVAPAGIITAEFSGLFDVAPPPVVTLEQAASGHHSMS